MDFTVDNQGNFVVKFNGATITCTSDADCPVEAVCAQNALWSAIQPGMCACSVDFSRTGDNCHDLSVHGYAMMGLWLLGMVLALLSFILTSYDIYLLRKGNIKFKMTALQTSLGLLTAGAFCMVLASLVLVGEMLVPFTFVIRAGGQVKKGPAFFVFTNICVALAMFFVQSGMLNVCLVWLEVTDLRSRMGERNVKKFRTPALLFTMAYFVMMVVFVGLDRIIFLAYASIPTFILMLIGYAVGYFRLTSAAHRKRRPSNTVVRTSAADNPGFENEVGVIGLLGLEVDSKSKSSNRLMKDKRKELNIKRKLRNIANLTIAFSFFGAIGVATLIAAAGLNGSADNPIISITGFLHRASWCCFAACLFIICIYCHQQVCVLVGKKSRFITSQTVVSERLSSRASLAMLKKKSAGTLVRNRDDERRGMAEILNRENPELRLRFTEFVRSKYADEPLVFYDVCTKYQETAQTSRRALKGKNVLLQTMGMQIIDNFIREDSVKWVNVSDDIRTELLAAAERNDFDEHTFDKAKAMAFELLKQNFYNQFVAMLEKEARDEAAKEEEIVVNIKSTTDLNV